MFEIMLLKILVQHTLQDVIEIIVAEGAMHHT